MTDSKKSKMVITISSDSESSISSLDTRKISQIKKCLLKQSLRKITRRASDPGCGHSNSEETVSPIYGSPRNVNQMCDEDKLSNAKQHNPICVQHKPETTNDQIITDKPKEPSTMCKEDDRNFVKVGPDCDHDDIIVISDDDEPKEKRHCSREEEDKITLEAIIAKTLNDIDKDSFTEHGYERKKKGKVVLEISDPSITDTSSNGSTSTGKSFDGKKLEWDLIKLLQLSFTKIAHRPKTFNRLRDKRFK